MATRSRIGIELKDGSILSAYHHWDGYPEWLGRILKTHYNSKELAAELIDGGDMSSAWTNAGFNNETVAQGPLYYSQRGEYCPPRLDANLQEYLTQDAEEFAYVYTQKEGWLCYDTCDWHETYLESQEIPSGALAV
ncbi:hypothetical protein EBS02_00985 [bacterium]|nr:hypothetical protein [bacterium]